MGGKKKSKSYEGAEMAVKILTISMNDLWIIQKTCPSAKHEFLRARVLTGRRPELSYLLPIVVSFLCNTKSVMPFLERLSRTNKVTQTKCRVLLCSHFPSSHKIAFLVFAFASTPLID